MVQKRCKVKQRLKKRDIIFLLCVLTLPVLQFLLMYVFVNIKSFAMAFQDTVDGVHYTWAGLETFKRALKTLFQDVNYQLIMKNTFALYFWTQIFMQAISMIISYFVWKKVWGWKFFSIVLFLPSIISSVTFIMIIKKLFYGFLPVIFNNPEIIEVFNAFGTGFEANTVFFCFLGLGANLVLYLGAMSQIDNSVLEYGQLDGMNSFHEFCYIVFPHIWPTIISMFIIGIASMLSNQGLLVGFYGFTGQTAEVQTFGVKMYLMVLGKNYTDYTMLSAMGLFFTVIIVIFSYIARRAMETLGPKEE